jgi:hypothetical protein
MAGPKSGGRRPLWQTGCFLEQTCGMAQGALDPHLEVFQLIAGHRSAGKHPSGGIPLESSSRHMADARRLRFCGRVFCHLPITPKGLPGHSCMEKSDVVERERAQDRGEVIRISLRLEFRTVKRRHADRMTGPSTDGDSFIMTPISLLLGCGIRNCQPDF